jgi:hypothetical protein
MTLSIPIDTALYLQDDDTTLTGAGTFYGEVGGVARIFDTGSDTERWDGLVGFSVSAISATGNTYQLIVQGCASNTFLTGVQTLATYLPAAIGQEILPISSVYNEEHFRYLRLKLVRAGSSPSIKVVVWAQPLASIDELTLSELIQIQGLYWENYASATSNLRAWMAGTATGGTYGDGRYPLTDGLGNTVLVYAPSTFITQASFKELSDRLGETIVASATKADLQVQNNRIDTLSAAFVANRQGLNLEATRALLNAKAGPFVVGAPGLVLADPAGDVTNGNGYYRWSGSAWVWIASTMPLSVAAALGALQADVTQVIGRPVDPIDGGGVSSSMYLPGELVSHPGQLMSVKFYAHVAGTVQLSRYSKSGTAIHRLNNVFIAVSAGLQTLTPAQFGTIMCNAGDMLGMAGAGILTATASKLADAPGWYQVNADVDDRTLGTIQTNIRLEFQFNVAQHYQVVDGQAFLALKDQVTNHETRLDLAEEQLALMQADTTQIIGRQVDPVDGDPVAGGMYIFADPVAHPGPLAELKVWIETVATLTLAKYTKAGTTVSRVTQVFLTPTATGLNTFTAAHYGDFQLNAGDYLALSGNAVFAANGQPADGAGWWDVNPIPVDRTVGAPNTGNQLQAKFSIPQSYQAVNAVDFIDLQARVQTLEDADPGGGGGSVSDGTVLRPSGWLATGSADTIQGPIAGGRAYQRVKRSQGVRCLAHLATVADVLNGGTITGLTNVTAADAIYGTTALQLASTGTGALVTIAPLAANAVPTDVTGGLIRIWVKPILNIALNMDRYSIQLHSAGSPSAPTANYHEIPVGSSSWLKSILTSQNGAGRWQSSTIPANAFSAVGAGANLAAVTWARLIYRASSGNAFTIQMGNVEFVPNALAKAKCILSFDDGHLGQYTYAAIQMAKYGFRGLAYPSPPAILVDVSGSYMTSKQIKSLHDNLGWQIGSQAWSTEVQATVDGWSENEFTAEMSRLRNWQNAMGLTGGDHGSYFSGVGPTDMIAYPTFRKCFRSMRSFLGGNGGGVPLTYGESFPFGDPMAIRALNGASYTGVDNGDRLKLHVDQAIQYKGVAQFVWHNEPNIVTPTANIQNGFLQLLAYLDANRASIDVCTEEDLLFG